MNFLEEIYQEKILDVSSPLKSLLNLDLFVLDDHGNSGIIYVAVYKLKVNIYQTYLTEQIFSLVQNS